MDFWMNSESWAQAQGVQGVRNSSNSVWCDVVILTLLVGVKIRATPLLFSNNHQVWLDFCLLPEENITCTTGFLWLFFPIIFVERSVKVDQLWQEALGKILTGLSCLAWTKSFSSGSVFSQQHRFYLQNIPEKDVKQQQVMQRGRGSCSDR